jgi:serine protease Do
MDTFPTPEPSPRPVTRTVSRLPVLIGVLLALLALLYLPTYMQQLEYSKMRGEVRAIDEALGSDLGPKFGSVGKAYVLLAKKAAPSVVHIDTKQTQLRRASDVFGGLGIQETEGEASGVIVDPAGYIVTNNHVVDGAEEIAVTLSDGTRFENVEVIGTDPGSDLAVIKIPGNKLIAAEWGDSDEVEVGEMVLAIGNPFGLDRSVTSGIVSAKNRREVGNGRVEFLQTDAAVNPGNSGGPLINMGGKIIGINTAIVGQAYQGISFAVPSNAARDVYEQLKSGHPVVRGYLGVNLIPVTPELARRLGLKTPKGAVIRTVAPNSPAAKAGLKPHDVVVAWDDHPIEDDTMLRLLVARTKVGATVPVTILRNGEEMKLDVTVTQRPTQLGQ